MKIEGKIVDLCSRSIYGAELTISDGFISKTIKKDHVPDLYILPGFIDAHVHIESSMVTPAAFASEAVKHGTIGAIADPHEIANVLGAEGVKFMLNDAGRVPFRFMFGAPSCVPATPFESSGAVIDAEATAVLLGTKGIGFLSEMMNYPGVLMNDIEILEKLNAAKRAGKPIDGHAPGLSGESLKRYVAAGITTDHECEREEEGLEKISLGMKILIREGSAARNLDSLHNLISEAPQMVMLCSDDIHPDDLVKGHINLLVKRLLEKGHDLFDVLAAASLNPALHYGLNTGLLQEGDRADFIITDNLKSLNIISTYIDGRQVFDGTSVMFKAEGAQQANRFNCSLISEEDIAVDVNDRKIRVIQAYDGLLHTGSFEAVARMPVPGHFDTENDILKIVVKERYSDKKPVVGFINGFGISRGALASSIAHDSHNIVAVGTDDNSIVRAVNRVVEMKGGLSWSTQEEELFLPLNIGGIMSGGTAAEVADGYRMLTEAVLRSGSQLRAPYMTLSFMALLVIPELKIGDCGLFDVTKFEPVTLLV